jgi:hypothetical protein
MAKPVKVSNKITPSVNRIRARFDQLPKEAYEHWRDITPVRSGNARRRTRLQGSKIKADYNYAVPLDKGWSKQAPQGMSKPTLEYIKKRIARHILRK